jgi:hypothetical protein
MHIQETDETPTLQYRILGKAACIYGYPLVEMVRRCRIETRSSHQWTSNPPIDVARDLGEGASCHRSHRRRAMRSIAWINLAGDGRFLQVERRPTAREWNVVLRDGWGHDVVSLDMGTLHRGVLVLGPNADGLRVHPDIDRVRIGTSFAAVLACDRSAHAEDPAVDDPSLRLRINDAIGATPRAPRPAAVELWEGDVSDAFTDVLDRNEPVAGVAPHFYGNLCRALAHAPACADDQVLVAGLRAIGLQPSHSIDWPALAWEIRAGLMQGFEDAALAVESYADLVRTESISEAWLRANFGRPLVRAVMLRSLHRCPAPRPQPHDLH